MKELDLGAHLRDAEAMIALRGFAIQNVVTWPAPYVHTVGLTARGHPELVVLGLPMDVDVFAAANAILVHLGTLALTEPLLPDRVYRLPGALPVRVRQGILGESEALDIAVALYGDRVRHLLVEPEPCHG